MAIIPQPYLFSWTDVEAASDLDRLRLVLLALPDEELVAFLEQRRGKGRDDYPIRPVWNALLAGVVFGHQSAASLLRELRRNGELRKLCGFNPLLGACALPTDDAFGYFLALVIKHQEKAGDIFDRLVEELGRVLPSLGKKLAVDSKAISSFGKPVRDEQVREEGDGRRENDADWGVKTYRGERADGTVWEKVVRWFGFKLHLLVDSVYELPLGFKLTQASVSDSPELLSLVKDFVDRHPEIAGRSEELSADKGYDSAENNKELYDEHGIVPIIDSRRMWREEEGHGEMARQLNPERVDNILYDERGQLYCVCPAGEEKRELYYSGFEKDRGTQKWRCLAAACGFECSGRKQCETGHQVGEYGRVIRVPLGKDRRIFTPFARPSAKWKKAYKRRTAVERVNARLDRVLGFELHTIRGHAKMETRVSLALCVLLAMALGRIRVGQMTSMRSLISPVKRAA